MRVRCRGRLPGYYILSVAYEQQMIQDLGRSFKVPRSHVIIVQWFLKQAIRMFNKEETAQLHALFKEFTQTVEFMLHQTEKNDFGRKLEKAVSEVCGLSEGKCVMVSNTAGSNPVAAPCFKMGVGGYANIVYAALPTGHQFPAFLKILERIGCGGYRIPKDGFLSDSSPAELVVLISDSCPRCPLVVEAAGLLACGNPSIEASFVDVIQFQDFVKEYRIRSVPVTILDKQIVLIGAISAERIKELVQSRGTPKFEMEVVLSLIERHDISGAAGYLDRETGRAVVLDLLQDTEFSKRLSALVVLEKELDDNPDAVRAMVPSFIPMLSHSDARIRGDVADLLGKVGDPTVIPHLEPLASDPDPDVAESALDAIEELKKD
jgi:hypothetical protein